MAGRRHDAHLSVMRSLTLGLLLCLPGLAGAAELREFDLGAFDRAQAAGRLVMLFIDSGPSAAGMDLPGLVERLSDDDLTADAVFFHLDYQRQRNQLPRFRVDRDDTCIVYRGRQERGRLVGTADQEHLRRLLAAAR